MDTERIITHLATALIGALVTLGGAVLAAWRKNRETELSAGADLRAELRDHLEQAREEIRSLRVEIDKLKDERLKLKRALDRRDHRIERLEARVAELEGHSEPEVI